MAKDVWEKYRVAIGREIFNIHVDSNDIKLMTKYLSGQVEVDDLSHIMDYKERFITEHSSRVTWMDITPLTTEEFAWFVMAIYAYRQCGFTFGRKPFAVVIRHEKNLVEKLVAGLLDWSQMHALSRSEEMAELRQKFSPSGTARLYSAAYSLYVAASDFMAKAMGQLMYVDDVIDA